jgi:hypothetical protein
MSTKTTAIEIKQEGDKIELFLLTGLDGTFELKDVKHGRNKLRITNPIEALHLIKDTGYPNNDRFFWVDRDDFLIQWTSINGKKGASFSDVAAVIDHDGEPEAWLVAEYIKHKRSALSNSLIGSKHWFNTLISEHSRIGEFLECQEHQLLVENVQAWGKRLHETSKELLEWATKNKLLTND